MTTPNWRLAVAPGWASECGRVVLYQADCLDVLPQLIILVETHNHRFLFGNAWDNRWALYSNYLDKGGGTPAEVLAYVRGQGYTYRGKAK